MKLFGTIKSFDSVKGFGEITPEATGETVRFEKSAIAWGTTPVPSVGQRLSYELGANDQHQARALNLQTA
jgi:cold shock CspA family protein